MDQSSLERPARASAARINDQEIFGAEHDDVWPSRPPGSARRYHSDVKMEIGRAAADVQSMTLSSQHDSSTGRRNAVPPRKTATQSTASQPALTRRRSVDTEEIAARHSGNLDLLTRHNNRRLHWLAYTGIALCIMLVGWILLSALSSWWQVTQDDWHYGRPRTAQLDQVVGHGDSNTNPSHFIALNLNRHVQIIEFPGGDSTKVKIYLGPVLVGVGQDLAPVTLTFKDVNGDGKLDMIVNVQDSHFIFINDNGQFRPPHAGENIQP